MSVDRSVLLYIYSYYSLLDCIFKVRDIRDPYSSKIKEDLKHRTTNPESFLMWKIQRLLDVATKQGRDITLYWVPAHKGIAGNEKADQLAKQSVDAGMPPPFGIPFSDIRVVHRPVFKKRVAAPSVSSLP